MEGPHVLAAVQQFIDENEKQKHEYMREILELRSKVEYLERDLELLQHMHTQQLQTQMESRKVAATAQTQTATDDKLQMYRTKYYKYKMMYLGQPAVCSVCATRIPRNARHTVTQEDATATVAGPSAQIPLPSPVEMASRSPPASVSPGEANAQAGTSNSQRRGLHHSSSSTGHRHHPAPTPQQPSALAAPAMLPLQHITHQHDDALMLYAAQTRVPSMATPLQHQPPHDSHLMGGAGAFQQPHVVGYSPHETHNLHHNSFHAYPGETQGMRTSPGNGAAHGWYVPETYLPQYDIGGDERPGHQYPNEMDHLHQRQPLGMHPQEQQAIPMHSKEQQALSVQLPWEEIQYYPGHHDHPQPGIPHQEQAQCHAGPAQPQHYGGRWPAAGDQMHHNCPTWPAGVMQVHADWKQVPPDGARWHGNPPPAVQAAAAHNTWHDPQSHVALTAHNVVPQGVLLSTRSDPGYPVAQASPPSCVHGQGRRLSSPGHMPLDYSPAWREQVGRPSPRPVPRHTPPDVKLRSRQVWLAIQQATAKRGGGARDSDGQRSSITEQAIAQLANTGAGASALPTEVAQPHPGDMYAMGYACLVNGPSPVPQHKRARVGAAGPRLHQSRSSESACPQPDPSEPTLKGPTSPGQLKSTLCHAMPANHSGPATGSTGMPWSDVMAHIQALVGPAPPASAVNATVATASIQTAAAVTSEGRLVTHGEADHDEHASDADPPAAGHERSESSSLQRQQQAVDMSGPATQDTPPHPHVKIENEADQQGAGQAAHRAQQQPLRERQPTSNHQQQPAQRQKRPKSKQQQQLPLQAANPQQERQQQSTTPVAMGAKVGASATTEKWKSSQRRASHSPSVKPPRSDVIHNHVQMSITRYKAKPRSHSDSGSASGGDAAKTDTLAMFGGEQQASKRARLHAWQAANAQASQGPAQLLDQGAVIAEAYSHPAAAGHVVYADTHDANQQQPMGKVAAKGTGSSVLVATSPNNITAAPGMHGPRRLAMSPNGAPCATSRLAIHRQKKNSSPGKASGSNAGVLHQPQQPVPCEPRCNPPPPGFQRRRRTESVADDLAAVPKPGSRSNYTTCTIQPVPAAQMPPVQSESNDVSNAAQHLIPVTIKCVVDRPQAVGTAKGSALPSHLTGAQAGRQAPVAGGTGDVKYQEVVRGKAAREALQGYACQQCQDFYEAMASWKHKPAPGEDEHLMRPRCGHAPPAAGNSPGPAGMDMGTDSVMGQGRLQVQLIQENSRHRAKYIPPSSTPEGFWSLTFPEAAPKPSPDW